MSADVQIARSSGAVPANVHARCAAGGAIEKLNRTAACTSYRTAVGNQHSIACGRTVHELRDGGGACAAERVAVVDDRSTACGRAVVENGPAAECAVGRSAVVGDAATACG